MSGYAFDSSEGQFQFRDPSSEEIQQLQCLGQVCDDFTQQHSSYDPDAASLNQRTRVTEEQLSELEKRIDAIALSIQTVNNRFDMIERILKFFILPMAASTIAAVGAFKATEWYNKKYQKTLNKYVITAAAGGSTAAIIYLAVLRNSMQISDNHA